ncbi:hypothetical protein RvY_09165-2 [Ramazzottius varieornatus]|uniref:Gamma-aminobutyric acid type B receptor subunit 2 n=1 Tax=Ramazzottius varieornatus TaxID=947166 RepID=A0A1D1V8C8_RAMVA|nr:hypothetical protein RvY_09165-2 [Ramazzottius varieornatus]
MLQISAGATSPSLSDRSAFPSFFRTVAPDQSHNHARAAFLKHHGWRHVGTLNENTESYALAMNELVRVFGTHHDITFVATGSIGESKIKDHLTLLKEKDIRIIIGAFSAQFARKVFCQAYRIQLYGPRYVWLIPGSFPSNWWLDQRENSDCSNEELEEAIEGYLSVTVATGGASEVTPGFTAGISREDFVDLLGYPSISGTYSSEALAFDAVFAVAYTVRNSLPSIGASSLVPDKLIHTLSRLEFSGVSGPVSFVGGDRVGNSVFRQYVEKEFRVVAVYQAESHYLSFNCSRCLSVSWRGQSKIPVDRRKSLHGIESIDLHTFVGVTIVSCFGISLSLTFLCFNFRFRNHKFIKLSSPKLNNTTAIGCCLVYGSVIAFGVDYGLTQSHLHMHAICQIRIFLLSSGFSVAFGSLFLKTFRVHRIFRRASRGVIKSRLLRDNQLLAGVALLFCTDIAFQLIWYLTDPVDVQLRRLPALHSHIDLDTVYIRDVEVCSSQFMGTIWLPVMYFYKGLMLLAGIFLTLETRNVKVCRFIR